MRSLGQRAYDRLLGILFSGELRPNDVVMERRLAEKLGVSRTPLREAIRRLQGEKLLERQKGGAIIVSPMSVEGFLNILSVRRLLEGEAAKRAARLISSEDLLRFRERITEARNGANPKNLAELGRELHLYIAHSSGNPVLASVIEDMGKRTRLFIRSFMRVSELREQVCEEHLALIAALLQKDGEAAKAAREQHIDNIRTYILGKLATL
jgi:DNA-binding GntR family transcriptional regulator